MQTLRVPRRRFLKGTGVIAGIQLAGARLPFPFSALSARSQDQTSPDHTLHIKTSPIEIAPKRIISAITYNGQFPGPLLRFKEGQRSASIFTTTRTLRSSCIGTDKGFPSMSTEPPKKERRSYPPMASDELRSRQIRPDSGSITPTIARVPISQPDSTEEKSGRFTLNPLRNRAGMTARSFSCSRSSSPLLVAVGICLKTSCLQPSRTRS
jgi:hypothetical protein